MDHNRPQPILNPMPSVIMGLFVFIAGIEVIFVLGSMGILGDASAIGWRNAAVSDYALTPAVLGWMLEQGQYPSELLVRFVTYSFVNGSTVGAAVSIALLLAMGRMVGQVFSQWAVLLVYLISAVLGAVVFSLVAPDAEWLFGSFVGIYGLIGAYSFINWVALRAGHGPQAQAFTLIAMLMGVQLLFAMFFGANSTWIADLAAFVVGFGLSFFVAPGGLRHILAAIRRD